MQPVVSADQMRQIDRLTVQDHNIPSLQLMQAASEACFLEISNYFSGNLAGKKVQILCGPGNNGGDGAALAQQLANWGTFTDVVLLGRIENTRGDARTNFEQVRQLAAGERGLVDLRFSECYSESAWTELSQRPLDYDLIVDALFGTGLSRPLEELFLQVVRYLVDIRRMRERSAASQPLILSIDIPSGLNADLAEPFGEAVHADVTVTFTAPKPANVLPPASHLNGELRIANIGSPATLVESQDSNLFVTEQSDVRDWLVSTRYLPGSFKNTHGHALVIAGSRGYTGAAVLCGNAAMRAGAGLTTIATPASAQASVASTVMPEVMTTALAETDRGTVTDDAVDHVMRLARKATVIAVGPGLTSEDERTRRFVYSIVKDRRTPMVLDADALNCLAPWPEELQGSSHAPLILTPHPGEMLRLLGTKDKSALDDAVAVVRDFAIKNEVILVLKGSRSLIAAPNGRIIINPTGNAGLGTAGAGDTLTGIIAAFVAQSIAGLDERADELSATVAALYVGGLAGDLAARELGMRAMLASDIREHLGEAMILIDPNGERPGEFE